MNNAHHWERIILDAAPPVSDMASLAVGDIAGDGHQEYVVGGNGALLWYRPDTAEKGVIAQGHFVVALGLEDVDGDGMLEVFAGETKHLENGETVEEIAWFDSGDTLDDAWTAYTVATNCNGSAHDLLFCDIDGDGKREMVANAAYCDVPGLFIYKPGSALTDPWQEFEVSNGIFSEGISIADLDGDGQLEIIHGPDWFKAPAEGPLSGTWERHCYATAFREMSRTAVADVTGNGVPDIVIVESEYVYGIMAWFENRIAEGLGLIEHRIRTGDLDFNFAHSLQAWNDADGMPHIFVGEMASGGWGQPYNWNARLFEFTSTDHGTTWQVETIEQSQGTHQAMMVDVDGDGQLEVAGKEWGNARLIPRVHLWKRTSGERPFQYKHILIDRDKPHAGTDIFTAEIEGKGKQDIVCGRWWYKNPGKAQPAWERHPIPGVAQLLSAYDIDGDGQDELIATKLTEGEGQRFSNVFCWLKALDPANDVWEMHDIGVGDGDWPHGNLAAPVLPGGKLAFIAAYHSAHSYPDRSGDYPQIFEVPDDPTQPWPKRILAEISYGEEMVATDLTGNGLLDVVAGGWLIENNGDGTFTPNQLADDLTGIARIRTADINGNGLMDIVFVMEDVDYRERVAGWVDVAWLENPGLSSQYPWTRHVIDKVRSPHSVDIADLNGDGQAEIIVGEHDPFTPYRSHSRLLVYKQANVEGTIWKQYVVDNRFEHHDGTKVVELWPGKLAIISHGWADSRYVHLWLVE